MPEVKRVSVEGLMEADERIVLSEGAPNRLEGVWPDRRFYAVSRLELHLYRSPNAPRARALVYPGGGYLDLVHDKEGVAVALWLAGLGVDAYVVTHRLPGQADPLSLKTWPSDIARADGLACLDYLQWLPQLPLLHVGLSSGGHLAGVMACQDHPVRAAGLIVGYAPLNANHRNYKAPAGKPDYPPVEKQAFYDRWPIGVAGEPHGIPAVPAFLVYALRDEPVPLEHALNFLTAMRRSGGDVEAHIFPDAPHGFALRDLDGTHGQWPELAGQWITRTLARGEAALSPKGP
ncbi:MULTISPECIES: S9 family peptidase [Asticcacaulis]|uniref:alpha/beta hydrolase family protein n=1 Tax=Asticcacaulis TaxID=76890 RepID=UPI001AE43A0C|nr:MULTISPECIES: prolyl oligopeptidase family serine peptidase [Asticcacaulis]MBP2157888.1 acetyl esterase/lipase [Asticcacaulis solisilvae]MDR6798933.1 acetyl esterase/lipase [Asticcacaulis sp. BE141]